MFKRKPSRSRQYRRDHQVIDLEEARRERRKKREERAQREEEKRRREEERKLSARQRRQRRNRAMIYFFAILVIVVILIGSAWKIFSLEAEKSRLEDENKRLTEQREDLQTELENVNDPEYVEHQAREQLSLIKPGETLYILPPLPSNENEDEGSDK